MSTDPPSLAPDDLEAHVVWLRRLARSLVGDEHAAEDLAQETWARALERRPATDRSVAPWLTVVARNLGRMARRSAARRGSHRPLEERDARTPATDDVVVRAEAARRLVAAVTELDEPFRTTVLLRYSEGLSGAEIARRTGVPDGTVRWRLKRGLDALRSRLDVDGDRGGRAVGVLLLPFGRSEASGAGASALAAGGVVMGLKAIAAVVLGVALVGAAGWLATRSGSTPPAAEGSAAGTSAAVESDDARVPAGGSDGGRAEVAAVREVVSAAPAGAAPSEGTVVRVVDAADRPVSGATVTLGAGEGEAFSPTATVATTDEAGEATLAFTLDEDATVFVDHLAYAPTVERLKVREAPVVVLRASAALSGAVRTFDTRAPIAGARVSVGWSTWGSGSPLETTTDREGRYRLPRVPVGEEIELWVRRSGFVAHRQVVTVTGPEERVDLLLPAGVTLRGRVIDGETEVPLSGVDVDGGERVVTDEQGRFVVRGLVEETPTISILAPGYCRTQFTPRRASVAEADEVVFPVFRGAEVCVRVRDADGRPREGAKVLVHADDSTAGGAVTMERAAPEHAREGMRLHPAPGSFLGRTDETGRVRLAGLPPGLEFRVLAIIPGWGRLRSRDEVISIRRPMEVVEFELVEPPTGVVMGALIGSSPRSLQMRWIGPTSSGYLQLDPAESREFRIETAEAGLLRLEVLDGARVTTSSTVQVEAGRVTRHDVRLVPMDGRVEGVVRSSSGLPVEGAWLHLVDSSDETLIGTAMSEPSGRFAFRFAADTATELEIQYDWTLETFFLEPHAVRVGDEEVELVLPRVAHPRLRIVDADTGVPLPRVLVGWRMELGDRTIAPDGPSPWRPGLHGVAPHRLPAGPITLVLDATLLGYDVTEIEEFLVPSDQAETVREIRLRNRR